MDSLMSGVISVQCGSLTWLFVSAGFRGPWFERTTGERVGEKHEWLFEPESSDHTRFYSVELQSYRAERRCHRQHLESLMAI